MKMGADIVTIPQSFWQKMAAHPLTDKGVATFLSDWKAMKKHNFLSSFLMIHVLTLLRSIKLHQHMDFFHKK